MVNGFGGRNEVPPHRPKITGGKRSHYWPAPLFSRPVLRSIAQIFSLRPFIVFPRLDRLYSCRLTTVHRQAKMTNSSTALIISELKILIPAPLLGRKVHLALNSKPFIEDTTDTLHLRIDKELGVLPPNGVTTEVGCQQGKMVGISTTATRTGPRISQGSELHSSKR